MKQSLTIINSQIPGYQGLQKITLNSEQIIESILPMTDVNLSEKNQVIDVNGDWISLGGIDLQINGGLGLAFPDLEAEHLPKLTEICQFLWRQGVDGFLPTIVTTSEAKIQQSLAAIAEFMKQQKTASLATAQILGVHLEGPFLNFEKRGAHPPEYLLPLSVENLKKILGEAQEIVKIITLAPELEANSETISYLREQGITVSLGHSLATDEEAKKAFQKGASMVTHAFNAMPNLHHRQPGLLGEAMMNQDVYCGLIADGQHVCPTMIKIFLKAIAQPERIFLVSDALAPIGLGDGIYPWDRRKIEVKNGTARLEDGTLSGTTLPLLVGVKNLVKWEICDLETAITMATESPRKAIGLKGITTQQPASLLRWSWENSDLVWRRLMG